MATFTLNYTIPQGGTTDSVVVQATITAAPNPGATDGSYLISKITGTRTVNGSVVENITGPDTGADNGGADNLFFPGNNGNGPANSGFVDLNGLAYFIDPATQSANDGTVSTSGVVNFYRSYSTQGASNHYGEYDSGTTINQPPQQGAAFSTSATCFATGTLIRTSRGDIAVEALAVGDLAVTASGSERPIRWLGHRPMDLWTHPRPREVLPVRIAAHAFGPNRPVRDLTVSPSHSICVDVLGEALIPARALVNGTTVVQLAVDTVEYWHVELDSHDILIANGLPAESYLDMGNRDFFFENGVVAVFNVSPDADRRDPALRTHADFCRPFHAGGLILDIVRAQLEARAIEIARVAAAA